MSTKTKRPPKETRRPELKIGPFQGGIGVAVWLNQIETAEGPRMVRSVTIAPRSHKVPKTGEWKDAVSYRPADLSVLILALERVREFLLTTPLPGEQVKSERLAYVESEEDQNGERSPF